MTKVTRATDYQSVMTVKKIKILFMATIINILALFTFCIMSFHVCRTVNEVDKIFLRSSN